MKKLFLTAAAISTLVAGQALAQGRNETPNTRPREAGQNQTQGRNQNQNQGQNQQGRNQQGQNQQSNSQQLDQHAAACLLIGNQEEIALSELAAERAESSQVKEFARDMIKEHTMMVSKLRKFAPQQSASFELKTDSGEGKERKGGAAREGGAQNGAGRSANAAGDREQTTEGQSSVRAGEATAAKAGGAAGGAAAGGSGSMMDQLLSIERDKAQHCLTLTKQNLQEHKGADFDKAFMGAQVSAHISMLAKLQALEGKVSGQFAEVVAEGRKTTEEHLDHAKQVMQQVAHAGGSERGARGQREEGGADRSEDRQPRNERGTDQPRRERNRDESR
jgi:predicted outer membrane protein